MSRPLNPWKLQGYKPGQNVICKVTNAEPGGYAVIIPKDNLPGFLPTQANLRTGEEILAQYVCVHNNRILLSARFSNTSASINTQTQPAVRWEEHLDDIDTPAPSVAETGDYPVVELDSGTDSIPSSGPLPTPSTLPNSGSFSSPSSFSSSQSPFSAPTASQSRSTTSNNQSSFGGATSDNNDNPFGGATSDNTPYGGATSDSKPYGSATPDNTPYGGATSDNTPYGGATSDNKPYSAQSSDNQSPFAGPTPSNQPSFAGPTSSNQPSFTAPTSSNQSAFAGPTSSNSQQFAGGNSSRSTDAAPAAAPSGPPSNSQAPVNPGGTPANAPKQHLTTHVQTPFLATSDAEAAFNVWAQAQPRKFHLKRATDLILPPLQVESENKFKIADYDLEWLITDLEGGMRTGCVKAGSEQRLSRSAMLLYRGRAVGCIYGCKSMPETQPTEQSLGLMLADLELPETNVRMYDLPESVTLAMSALFLGYPVQRNDEYDAISYMDYICNWFESKSNTACLAITLPASSATCLGFIHKGQFCGAFYVEDQKYTTDVGFVHELLRNDPKAGVEASILPPEMTSSAVRFGFSLSMARQRNGGR